MLLLSSTILSALLLSGQALAGLNHHFAGIDGRRVLGRRDLDIEQQLRRHADDMIENFQKRQSPTSSSSAATPSFSTASGDASKVDFAKWETDTELACDKALKVLNGQASNPTGMAVCYNLPFLDNSTGVFQAELRLYNISQPIAPWTNVQLSSISMTLSYLGATVQMMNMPKKKRDSTLSWPPIKERSDSVGKLVERWTPMEERHQGVGTLLERSFEIEERDSNDSAKLIQRQDASPTATQSASTFVPTPTNELKVLMYVGKVNSNLMGSAMSNAELQQYLVPTIRLAAKDPSDNSKEVDAILSGTEASFVNGVFAKAVSPTDSAAAQASASALAATAAPFKIPGISLGVPPIGITITLVWTLLFCAAVGFGTVGRIRFRDQYRRRVKAQSAQGLNTF